MEGLYRKLLTLPFTRRVIRERIGTGLEPTKEDLYHFNFGEDVNQEDTSDEGLERLKLRESRLQTRHKIYTLAFTCIQCEQQPLDMLVTVLQIRGHLKLSILNAYNLKWHYYYMSGSLYLYHGHSMVI